MKTRSVSADVKFATLEILEEKSRLFEATRCALEHFAQRRFVLVRSRCFSRASGAIAAGLLPLAQAFNALE